MQVRKPPHASNSHEHYLNNASLIKHYTLFYETVTLVSVTRLLLTACRIVLHVTHIQKHHLEILNVEMARF